MGTLKHASMVEYFNEKQPIAMFQALSAPL